jgi:hypothetical protein
MLHAEWRAVALGCRVDRWIGCTVGRIVASHARTQAEGNAERH